MLLGPRFGDYPSGFRFGKLAVDLVEQRGLLRFKARAYLGFAYVIPVDEALARRPRALVRRAFDAAQETGRPYLCGLFAVAASITHLLRQRRSARSRSSAKPRTRLEFVQKASDSVSSSPRSTDSSVLIRTLARLDAGLSDALSRSATFDERLFEQHLEDDPRLAYAGWRYWIRKLQARYLPATIGAARCRRTEGATAATHGHRRCWRIIEAADYHFYGALARAGRVWHLPPSDGATPRHVLRPCTRTITGRLRLWADELPRELSPDRATLVGAEIARLEGRELDADAALRRGRSDSAREHGFVQNEGHRQRARRALLCRARLRRRSLTPTCGTRGPAICAGAPTARSASSSKHHPHLRQRATVAAVRQQRSGRRSSSLELATVVKVSQAVSGEIDLKKLIDTLMVIALEHAGGDRGLLIVPRGDELQDRSGSHKRPRHGRGPSSTSARRSRRICPNRFSTT